MSATILVIDDAQFIRTMLKSGLEKVGLQVVEAASGIEGERILATRGSSIDLVICDISMPEQDGIETLKNIKASYPNLPVVMLTAHSDRSSVVQCAQAGISGFLAKPFDIKRVRAKVFEVLQIQSTLEAEDDE
jgi:DNA-binding NtrC family response regulator